MKFHTKRILFSLFILTFSITINSQNQTPLTDSLTQKSYQELSDLFYFYKNKPDTLKAIKYANIYFKKALNEKNIIKTTIGKEFLAEIKNNKSIFLNYCDSLIFFYSKKPTKNLPAIIHLKKSRFFFHKRENSNSLKELIPIKKYLIENKNDSIKFLAIAHLATIKNSIKKDRESLILYKKAYDYAKKKKYLKFDSFSTLPLNISLAYRNLNKIDSAYTFNQIAIDLYKSINDSVSLGYSFYTLGYLQDKKKEYKKSINSFKKAIPSIINDENYRILTRIYIKLGVLYHLNHNLKNALKYHIKADSIYDLKKIPSSTLDKTYSFLYEYYKDNNNLKEQLKYLNKLLDIKEFTLKEKNKINETFSKEYDIPNLLAEKKKIITKLEIEAKDSKRNKLIYITLLFISIILIVYQINKKRVYKKRFLALINQEEKESQKVVKEVKPSNTKLSLPDAVIKELLNKLTLFEKNKDFLHSNTNLQNLATKFNTNSNYLSKVINQHKNLTFTNYINNLRIEYTIQKLKTDSLLRKYTIKAIATEVGFKNSESFSKAFFKYTGIKPSYFIKQLTNSKN